MKVKQVFILFVLLVVSVVVISANAQVPNLLNYQGKLNMGATPASGTFSITFSIYSTATGGTALWFETQNVTVTNGVFNVLLGSVTAFPSTLFTGTGERHLGIKVGTDPEMTPRFRLTSAAYAMRAAEADGVANNAVNSAKIQDGQVANADLADNAVTSTKILNGTIVDADISATAAIAQSKISNASRTIDADRLDGLDASDFAKPPVLTELQYRLTNTDNSISSTYELIRTVGTFTKVLSNTDIELTWIAHASTNGTFCDFQLRIDDNPSLGTLDTGGRAVLYTAESPVAVTVLFRGLSAGLHTVSIWVRGTATSCTLNRGNFPQTVFVKEISQTVRTSIVTSAGDVDAGEGIINGVVMPADR